MAARMSKSTKVVLWSTAGAAAVVLALTGYSALTGNHGKTSPSAHKGGRTATAGPSIAPTYTVPPDWTEPARWAALPVGARTDSHGNRVGFPHTTDGAVATLAASDSNSIAGTRSAADVQLSIYDSYMSAADRTPANEAKVVSEATQENASLRRSMGLPVSGPLPPGAYVHIDTVGFKVISASPDRVSAYLLTRVARKAGETKPEKDSYTVAVLAVEWSGGDWKVSGSASSSAAQQAQGSTPGIAAPGDATFNADGWTAIREAS